MTSGPAAGELVLLLHGFPETARAWQFQQPALADAGFRVWAPDLRGFNLTSKPRGVRAYHYHALTLDVEELLNAARAPRAVIVGHDWGGILAWWFAMDYPERVSKLVVMNAPHPAKWRHAYFLPEQWLRSWYIGLFQLPWLPERFLRANARALVQALRLSAVRRHVFTPALLEEYARAMEQPGAMQAGVNYYRALIRWGFWRKLKPIDAPTMMIWGENDVALSKALTDGTADHVRDFRLYNISNCGHWVQQEAAIEVNRLLLDFIS